MSHRSRAVAVSVGLLAAACGGGDEAARSGATTSTGVRATLVAQVASYDLVAGRELVYGMSNTTCEAQRQCAALADQLGGLLDSHTSL